MIDPAILHAVRMERERLWILIDDEKEIPDTDFDDDYERGYYEGMKNARELIKGQVWK